MVSISRQVGGVSTISGGRLEFSWGLQGTLELSHLGVGVWVWVRADVCVKSVLKVCACSSRAPLSLLCIMGKRQKTSQQTSLYTPRTPVAHLQAVLLSLSYRTLGSQRGSHRSTHSTQHAWAPPSGLLCGAGVWPTLSFLFRLVLLLLFVYQRLINHLLCDQHCFRSRRKHREQNQLSPLVYPLVGQRTYTQIVIWRKHSTLRGQRWQ